MEENDWASEQYTKIQDFVIINRLYRDYPEDMSHADIVISEIMKLKETGIPKDYVFTKEDWYDLYKTIEDFKLRVLSRMGSKK